MLDLARSHSVEPLMLPALGREISPLDDLVSLARMGHARARAKIVRDLRSFFRDRRTLAVAAVGRARLAEAKHLVEAMCGDESRADAEAVALTLEQLGARAASPDRGRPAQDFAP